MNRANYRASLDDHQKIFIYDRLILCYFNSMFAILSRKRFLEKRILTVQLFSFTPSYHVPQLHASYETFSFMHFVPICMVIKWSLRKGFHLKVLMDICNRKSISVWWLTFLSLVSGA